MRPLDDIFGTHTWSMSTSGTNSYRPHRSLGQLPPQPKGVAPAVLKNVDPSQLKRIDRLGGVIHEYRLVA